MKRWITLLLLTLFFISLCSCQRKADIVIDAGHAPEYSTYDEIPADREVLVLNTETRTVHRSSCRYAVSMKKDRRLITDNSFLDYFTERGYAKCRICFPEKGGT